MTEAITNLTPLAAHLPSTRDPRGYQWQERHREVELLVDMPDERLRGALMVTIDTLLAMEELGLNTHSGDFDAWRDGDEYVFWVEGVLPLYVAKMTRDDLLQAHCATMDLIDDIESRLPRLEEALSAWRTGEVRLGGAPA